MARKYGKKASEKIGRTMHEFKRGKLKSGRSGKKVTSRKQALAIGLSQARRAGYKVPRQPPGHATMSLDQRVRTYLSKMRPGAEIDGWGMARALKIEPIAASHALDRAEKAGRAVTSDGRWFGPAGGQAQHQASKKKYPYIAYWIRSRGLGGRDAVPIYVLGTTTRADEGIVGHDLRVRPLRLGKGSYTAVVSPDDVEDKP